MFNFKSHSRFGTFFLLVLAVIAASGAGCQQREKQPGPPEKVTMAYSTAFNAVLVHIAFVNGYFTQEGLDAKLQAHAFGKLALQAVIEGRADVATVADTPVMFAIMDGKRIAILAAIQTSNRNEAIVARKGRGISEPSDLKGKRIGVTLGTTSDFFLDALLMAHGIDRTQVKIRDMAPNEMAAALSAGKIDAASAFNPVVTQLQNSLGNKGSTFYGETLYTETFFVTAGQDFVKERPEAVRKLLRALIKAEIFVREHPDEARRLVAEFLKADKPILDKVWDVYNFEVTLNQALIVDLEDQTRWAMKYRLTANKVMPNYLDFIHVDGLRAVKPGAVDIIQ